MSNPQLNLKVDPVCGMDLTGRDSNFCGKFCAERFEKEPAKFQKTPLIKLSNVWKVFKMGDVETPVLRGLNLHIWEGDFVAIIGSSGSGKTTVLNMVGLLDRPTSGQIFLKGQDVSLLPDEKRAKLRSQTFGFVFQQYNLIPWLTAAENIALPLILAGRKVENDKLEALSTKAGLKERLTHRPFELSGGEQQRTALLRALGNDPEIILGDEPTGNLDSATGDKILEMLIELNKIQKKTLVIVTHDADIAEKADQVITLKDGQMVSNHQIQKKIYTE